MAIAPNGCRIPGVFHRMTKEEMFNVQGYLEVLTCQWHTKCLINNCSAGFMIENTGGSSERGSLLTPALNLGPFYLLINRQSTESASTSSPYHEGPGVEA